MTDKRRKLWRTYKSNKTALIGSVIAILIIVLAILAPWIAPYDPLEQSVFNRLAPPKGDHLLGTDEYGRDVLSRILWGARISLMVGVLSVIIGLAVGTWLGMVAGYRGGVIEAGIMRMVDVLLSFPTLITGIMVVALMGPGLFKLILTIGIVFSPRFARLAYGPTLAVKEKEYVQSAKVIGASHFRILTRYILPNILGEVLVAATLWIGTAVIIEASLSFLGLGVSPPMPTWGNMIKGGIDRLTNAPWLSVFPGLAILITVLSFNMIGDGLRDIADPKLRI
jgi:peptide/nickel transport system permease protein